MKKRIDTFFKKLKISGIYWKINSQGNGGSVNIVQVALKFLTPYNYLLH